MKKEITSTTQGIVGYLHSVEIQKDEILIFQLPRHTSMLSETYIQGALKSIREILPDNRKAIIIGADVNIYSIAGEEATTLVLKGLI